MEWVLGYIGTLFKRLTATGSVKIDSILEIIKLNSTRNTTDSRRSKWLCLSAHNHVKKKEKRERERPRNKRSSKLSEFACWAGRNPPIIANEGSFSLFLKEIKFIFRIVRKYFSKNACKEAYQLLWYTKTIVVTLMWSIFAFASLYLYRIRKQEAREELGSCRFYTVFKVGLLPRQLLEAILIIVYTKSTSVKTRCKRYINFVGIAWKREMIIKRPDIAH